MANLSITRRCKRYCTYCFAKHELARKLGDDMSPEIYEAALEFLERSNFPEVRLLGGEPTEHPRFIEYVNLAFERAFRVVVFSGGMVPQPVEEYMARLPADNFSVVLNAADPSFDAEVLVKKQRKLCKALGEKITLGVNIRSYEQDPTFLFDWVNEYDVCRTLRVGVAHPIWGGVNDYFVFRGPRVIPILERLVAFGDKLGINVGFDCGITPCMFSRDFVTSHYDLFMLRDADHSKLSKQEDFTTRLGISANIHDSQDSHMACTNDFAAGQDPMGAENLREAVGVRCNPVIDILVEGDCISCYALSRFGRLPLPLEGNRYNLVKSFDRELLPVLPVGVHRECTHCDYLAKGLCSGGCRARRALRLRPDSSTALASK